MLAENASIARGERADGWLQSIAGAVANGIRAPSYYRPQAGRPKPLRPDGTEVYAGAMPPYLLLAACPKWK
jgi:hypothetical protein